MLIQLKLQIKKIRKKKSKDAKQKIKIRNIRWPNQIQQHFLTNKQKKTTHSRFFWDIVILRYLKVKETTKY